jgi:hypothetical protein
MKTSSRLMAPQIAWRLFAAMLIMLSIVSIVGFAWAHPDGGNPGENLLWLTFMIAGMDSINPCAFYILTFLLSILIYAKDRVRILLVGGIFVLVSGLAYFLFMAAILNVFRILSGFSLLIPLVMAAVAATGALNVKDYFAHGRGPSLGASEKSLAQVGRSARRLLRMSSLGALAAESAALAFIVNIYELACTPGFPLYYTSLLSSLGIGQLEYYLYLILYNVVYVLPMLGIVLIFAYTLGRMRMSEAWSRRIKLFSGYMMIALAISMLLRPWVFTSLGETLQLIAASVAVTLLTILAYERGLSRHGRKLSL